MSAPRHIHHFKQGLCLAMSLSSGRGCVSLIQGYNTHYWIRPLIGDYSEARVYIYIYERQRETEAARDRERREGERERHTKTDPERREKRERRARVGREERGDPQRLAQTDR